MTKEEQVEMAREFIKELTNLNYGVPFKDEEVARLQADIMKFASRKYFEIFNEKL